MSTLQQLITIFLALITVATSSVRDDITANQEYGASLEATNEAVAIAEAILDICDTDTDGILITCLGDSITGGLGEKSYPSFMSEILGAEVINLGIGGSHIMWGYPDSMAERYTDIPKDSDVILLYGGINDSLRLTPDTIGDIENEGSFRGSLYMLLTGIKEEYPEAYFVTVIPPPIETFSYYQEEIDPTLYDESTLRQELLTQCRALDIEFIDLFDANVMNPLDEAVREAFFADDFHPNLAGQEVLAKLFSAKIAVHLMVQNLDPFV